MFRDVLALTFDDPDHSLDERRFITIGESAHQRVLFVTHADRRVDRIRIISARRGQEKPMPTRIAALARRATCGPNTTCRS